VTGGEAVVVAVVFAFSFDGAQLPSATIAATASRTRAYFEICITPPELDGLEFLYSLITKSGQGTSLAHETFWRKVATD
jgi:hypothetical protein